MRRAREQGFTLIELVVALSLFAVILTLAFGGLRFGARAWDTGNERSAQLSELRVAHRVVTRMLGRMFPMAAGTGGDVRYVFEGAGDRVRFVAYMPPYPDVAGPYEITLTAARTRDGTELRLSRIPFIADRDRAPPKATAQETVVFRTPHRIEFAYYDPGDKDQEGAWVPRWDDTERMPARLRLRLRAGADEDAPWPAFVVRLAIDMDTACLQPKPEGLCRLRK